MGLGSASVINSSVKVACYEPFFPTAVQSCWVFFGMGWVFVVAFLPIVKYAEMVMKRVLGNFKCGSGCARDPSSILSSKVNHWSRNYRDKDCTFIRTRMPMS